MRELWLHFWVREVAAAGGECWTARGGVLGSWGACQGQVEPSHFYIRIFIKAIWSGSLYPCGGFLDL